MINWPAIKEAALPKGYTGGRIHWNPWIGEYRAHPSDNDLELLSKLPESKYERMRDLIADNDQWAREDAVLRRSMHWKPLNYIPLPIAAVPAVAAADAKAANKLVGDPQYEEARKIMHQTIQLDPKRVLKYRKKIDNLVADLRAKAAKTAADPRQRERFNKNHDWLLKLRLMKGSTEIMDIHGNTLWTDGKGL